MSINVVVTKELVFPQVEASTKEELEKIPVIDIEDIRKDVKPLSNVESELGGVKVLCFVSLQLTFVAGDVYDS